MNDLPSDVQEKYDSLIEYINRLPLDINDKQILIDKVDDVITWIITSD